MEASYDNFDCIVVGSGHAGSCAALAAVDAGCTKVLMVDKCPEAWVGGNGYFTAGAHRTVHNGLADLLKLSHTPLSAEKVSSIDIDAYTREDFIADIQCLGGGRADPRMVGAVVDNSRETLRWLRERIEVKFMLSFHRQAYEVNGRTKFWGGMALSVEDGGKGLIESHRKALREAGVEVWFETRAVDLVMGKEDEVCGIILEKGGEKKKFKARSVILAAGGFEASPELRRKYLGERWEKARVRGTPYNTGDGLELARAVGAKMTGDWEGCHSTAWDANANADAGEREMTNKYTKSGYPLGIMVNMLGKRFVDEGEDYRNYTYAKFGRAILEQPGGCAFQIWDSKVLDHLRKEEYGEGVVKKAWGQTIEGLADKLIDKEWGLEDKEQFVDTVREFNKAVKGDGQWNPAVKDGLSTKGLKVNKTNWALTISNGPFMAVKVGCGITFTFGGVGIDENTANVLSDKTGEKICGLFCAGEMVGGLFYGNYPGGSGLTAGAVFGRKAGTAVGARCCDIAIA